VYPHGNRISTPDAIGRELGRRLEKRYEVIYHDWFDRNIIQPEPGDVLLGHPHPDPHTVFRRSLRLKGWRRRLMLSPFNHGDLRQVAFVDRFLADCDLYLAITGRYWFRTLQDSPCSHWQPKMVQLDLAIDRADYPPLKVSFGRSGKRRVLYIGHTDGYKNTPYLSEIAALVPHAEFVWIGSGSRPIRGFTPVGAIDLGAQAGRDLVAQCDFLLTVGKADANPTTILEAMAWGLIPICTPTSGYVGTPSIPNVPLGDAASAAAIVRELLAAGDSDLLAMQSANWRLLDEHYTWDRFAAQVISAIGSTESPQLLPESIRRRAAFIFYDVTSPYSRAGRLMWRSRKL
jgi:glycosyltransferase involved in cell wall biosynthesis